MSPHMRTLGACVPGGFSSLEQAVGRCQLAVHSVGPLLAPAGFESHHTYRTELLRLWDRNIGLLGEVLVRLEYLSAGHGGGVVVFGCGGSWIFPERRESQGKRRNGLWRGNGGDGAWRLFGRVLRLVGDVERPTPAAARATLLGRRSRRASRRRASLSLHESLNCLNLGKHCP
jgi:hypothetical protein